MDKLIQKNKEIEQNLSIYSTPIMSEYKELIGSGVYCKYNDNYYVLTAGHVIKEICGKESFVFIPAIGNEDAAFNLKELKKRYSLDENNEEDFGFIEIPIQLKGDFEAGKTSFYNFGRTKYESFLGNERVVIGGFPKFFYGKTKIQFFSFNFGPAKIGSPLYNSKAKKLFNIPLDRSNLYSFIDQKEIQLKEEFSGMSGCGIWKVSDDLKLELVSIYVGSTKIKNAKVTDLFGSWIYLDEEAINKMKVCY